MSIRRSLARLENAAAKDTSELLPHLCRLLGVVDSICWPARFTSISNYHAICAAQQDYHSDGISFTLESSDQASWKASERLRGSLVDAGWASHCDNGKIRLTLAGDTTARLACGLPTIADDITVHLFEKLAELPLDRNGGWVSEASCFGLDDDEDYRVLHSLTEIIQPLVTNRCIESASSTIARVFYKRLTDGLPSIDVPSIDYSEAGSDEYTKAFCRSIEARRSATYSGNAIFVPLAATR